MRRVSGRVPPRTPVLRPDMPLRWWVDGPGDRRRQPPDHPSAENDHERAPGGAVGHQRNPGQDDGPHNRASNAVARVGVAPTHFGNPLASPPIPLAHKVI